ncbi:MAG: hypothetical protein ACXVAR_18235, partial [Vulcanimicrobiaceae bacterium]
FAALRTTRIPLPFRRSVEPSDHRNRRVVELDYQPYRDWRYGAHVSNTRAQWSSAPGTSAFAFSVLTGTPIGFRLALDAFYCYPAV